MSEENQDPTGNPGGSGGDATPWYGQVDEVTQGYIGNKGWKGASDVINGYRNLEKLMGHDRAGRTVTIPKEGEDTTDFYTKLGRPSDADGYKFQIEGDESDLAKWFREQSFQHNLSQDQAAGLMNQFNARMDQLSKDSETDQAAEFDNQMSELKRDWGSAYDANMNAAKKAANKFGFTEQDIDAMEKAMGPKALFHRMSDIGRALAEDSFETGNRESNFHLSPAEAKSRIEDLKLDDSFMQKYMAGERTAVEKWSKLFQAAFPG